MRKPFFNRSKQCWYVWHDGKQRRLSGNQDDALQQWHELHAEPSRPTPEPAASNLPPELLSRIAAQLGVSQISPTVSYVLSLYLSWYRDNRRPATYLRTHSYLMSLERSIGTELRVQELKNHHITGWLSDHESWGQTFRCHAIKRVKAALNWAEREGHIGQNPLSRLQAPAALRREHAITAAEHDRVMSLIKQGDPFRDYVLFLYSTGARPQEARTVEARHCRSRLVVIPPSEAKGGRSHRVIYLPDPIDSLISHLVSEHPVGPLLRNRGGRPWTKDSVKCRLTQIKKKLAKQGTPIPALVATSWRHGYATEALKRGIDSVTVGVLMGHSDPSMVAKVYQHLGSDQEYLSRVANRIGNC